MSNDLNLELDKVDIEIMYVLFVNNVCSPMNGFSMNDIMDNVELKLSYYSILRRINNKLIALGYVLNGYKNGNSKSFYLSKEGIDYVKNEILTKEDVFEWVEVDDTNEDTD